MIRVFGYLTWRSLANRTARQLRHLRSPRYIIACLLGAAYLYAMLFQRRPAPPAAPVTSATLELLASILLAGAVLWAWVVGVERRVLAFSPAEVTFLFSGPVSRRDLVQYKLLRTQLLILFNTLLWTLVLSYERFGGAAWRRALAIWLLLTTLSLHRLGASFVRTSVLEHGGVGARRRFLSLAVFAAATVAFAWSVVDALPAVRDAWSQDVQLWLQALGDAARRPLPSLLLSPFRVAVRPLLAHETDAWLRAMGPAAALMVLHYMWVIRSDAAFEEAAVQVSLDRAQRRGTAVREPRAAPTRPPRPPFQLAPTGWPGIAILWKNLAAANRMRRTRTTLIAFLVAGSIVVALSLAGKPDLASLAGWLAMTWAGALVVVGPQWIRNDLRNDLLKIELLRSYPLRGRTVIAGEVMASAFVLVLLELGLLLFAYLAFLGDHTLPFALDERTALLAGAVLALPGVTFMGMLIQNGAALLYPAWSRLGADRPGGIEALGQNMLATVAFIVLFVLVLLVPIVLGGGVFFVLEPVAGMWAIVPAVLASQLMLAAEALPLVQWLGRVFERTDPSAGSIMP